MNNTITYEKAKGSDLRTGDVVMTCNNGTGYSHATVKAIGDGYITLFRPYVTSTHTEYSNKGNGVSRICYIGVEIYDIYPSTDVLLINKG